MTKVEKGKQMLLRQIAIRKEINALVVEHQGIDKKMMDMFGDEDITDEEFLSLAMQASIGLPMPARGLKS